MKVFYDKCLYEKYVGYIKMMFSILIFLSHMKKVNFFCDIYFGKVKLIY